MKRMHVLMTLILIINQMSFGQNNFYYTNTGDKIQLFEDKNYNIVFLENDDLSKFDFSEKLGKGIYKIRKEKEINNTKPLYLSEDGVRFFYKDEIVLKFKDNISLEDQNKIVSTFNLVLEKKSLSFSVYKSKGDLLDLANRIYETNLVEFCTPNFYGEINHLYENSSNNTLNNDSFTVFTTNYPNDEYFNYQWYLHNIGQGTNDGKSTTYDADIDALEAWEYTKGSSNIIIAVLDEGVTSNHPDLPNSRQIRLNGSNFAWQYDGTNDPNNPSPTLSLVKGNNHGNACAGLIAATQGNSEGITGVAPLCKILPIKLPFGTNAPFSVFAEAIDFAVLNNSNIISNSWGANVNSNFSPVLISSIQNAINSGATVLFAAGNTANHAISNEGFVSFPANANINDMIVVGASDRNDQLANYSPKNNLINITAPSHTAYPSQIQGESFNIWTLDIPSSEYGYNEWRDGGFSLPLVGENLPLNGINNNSYTGRMGGTSASTPLVAGVVALVKSINPNFTTNEINEIIYSTADKVGGYNYNWNSNKEGHSKELGYGRVNAHKAVLKAIELSKTDLVIRDNIGDTSAEPNDVQYFWESPDIWIRNYNDSSNEHQNPIYKSNNLPNFIKVRVKNNGGVASTGYEKLKIYWAKASTALSYPNPWHGGIYQEGNTNLNALMGSPLDSIYIPILQPNEETILTVPWVVPNPYVYIPETNNQNDRWHFCLLARIEADNDPMYTTETTDLATNVRNNNNIAQKNVTVSQFSNFLYGGAIAVGNHFNISRTFNLVFKSIKTNDKYLSDEAEVHIELSDVVFNAWKNGGFQSEDVRLGRKPKTIVLMSENAKLKNLQFAPNKVGAIAVNIHYLTQAVSQESYTLLVKQTDENDKIVGGETFNISRSPRDLFYAQADDKEVNKNETVVLSAEDINETAIYNWYDSEGNLVHEGANFETSVDIAKTYKLEIIATIDGYKDYKDVEVSLKSDHIVTVYPNPLATHANISYKINNATNAYLSITGVYGSNVANNYILDINQNNITIDMSSYPAGIYTVSLIANGSVVDQMSIIKQ